MATVLLTPAERLTNLNLYRILEIIDPANARRHDRDAESCELGTSARLAELFADVIELVPPPTPLSAIAMRGSEQSVGDEWFLTSEAAPMAPDGRLF